MTSCCVLTFFVQDCKLMRFMPLYDRHHKVFPNLNLALTQVAT